MNEHYLKQVTLYNMDIYNACVEYFNRFPEHTEWFEKELEELRWKNKFVGQFRNHISLTAVPLANKIHAQLNIITFPFIQRVACRGWNTSGGTWAWSMSSFLVQDVGSTDPVRYCLRKDIVLSMLGNGEICGDKVLSQE